MLGAITPSMIVPGGNQILQGTGCQPGQRYQECFAPGPGCGCVPWAIDPNATLATPNLQVVTSTAPTSTNSWIWVAIAAVGLGVIGYVLK